MATAGYRHHAIASPFVTHPETSLHNDKPFTIRADERSEIRFGNDILPHEENENEHNQQQLQLQQSHTQQHSQQDKIQEAALESDESRRMSMLKRAAPESSSELLEKNQLQDSKKMKVEPDYTWDDLDTEDADDPLMVSEYVNEIFDYLHELELKTLPDANYLHWQRNFRPKMRSILVDWMVEVHLKFRLLPETLYLAINIMDRFMSRETVQVDRLQLLATGSLFIAAKYEEVYSPSVKNYAYVTDGGFTEDEILQAERFILEILNFDMSYPNPMNFLRRISKADDYDVQARTIGKYLLEITAVDHKFIGYLPSLCAGAAMYIARKMLGKFDWNGNLIHYSGGYKESDLKEICEMLMDYLISPIIHEEFFKKYASRRFMKVSILARQWAKKVTREEKNIMDPVI
ncbi:G2/mitotic-specific cyclin [Brettanomyces nanus]|uniref:G2/mitotic-specific cyclin n=1 Tax=Eeniella nana TaxID=13502 RepID=A0A875RZY4_EENNA|nr:G2/mitotic-specific cyclin [Brettanomyces nanus]QPG73615.1 G2/mitotic-specific cyclin [Brettanomyces nanus]